MVLKGENERKRRVLKEEKEEKDAESNDLRRRR